MPWNDPGCFALRVRGDSMINAGILSGDKVVVRPQPSADDGQIVVARIEDEATVKRLRRRNGQIWLMPEMTITAPSTAPTRRSSASSRPWCGSIEKKVRATRKKFLTNVHK